MLILLSQSPGGSLASMAECLGWFYGNSSPPQPNKMRVSRGLEKLKAAGLATQKRGAWQLTTEGRNEAKNVG